jgi:hypothetical protein
MQNLSDNELDDLFKKAVAQSESDTVSSSSEWETMAGRLTASEKGAGILTGNAVWVVVSAIILSSLVLIYFLARDNSQGVGHDGGLSETVQPDNPETKASGESPVDEITFLQKATERQASHQSGHQVYQSNNRPNSLASDRDTDPFVNAGESSQLLAVDLSRIPDPSGQNKTPVQQSSDIDNATSTKKLIDAHENIEVAETMEDAATEDSGLYGSRFALKISGSPDFSSIGMGSPGKPGWNYGALIEYHLNSRWSVATGVLRTRKFYESSNVEYNGYSADWLDGDCRMWDIPVNVYYHFTSASKWSFFAGVGLSSYLMSRERYVYLVDSHYGQYRYEQEVNGENNEWFKMLNLSVGVEKRLNRNFSLQVEPFLKAPLAGVGEGDVSLASFGAFFSLKYSFLSKL